MTFWLMMHISKDFNKKNIILLGAFGIYHKELIYKSAAFNGEYFFYSGGRQICVHPLATRKRGCPSSVKSVCLSSPQSWDITSWLWTLGIVFYVLDRISISKMMGRKRGPLNLRNFSSLLPSKDVMCSGPPTPLPRSKSQNQARQDDSSGVPFGP